MNSMTFEKSGNYIVAKINGKEVGRATLASLGISEQDVEEMLEDYQPKLTAGENITIDENNVISASGGGSTLYFYTLTFSNRAASSTDYFIINFTSNINYNLVDQDKVSVVLALFNIVQIAANGYITGYGHYISIAKVNNVYKGVYSNGLATVDDFKLILTESQKTVL